MGNSNVVCGQCSSMKITINIMKIILIAIFVGTITLCNGATIVSPDISKLTSDVDEKQQFEETKDLESSASDRTFLIGREYGYGGSGYGSDYGYGNYPGNVYGTNYNRNNPNSIYRGYQTGLNGISGVGTGLGYGIGYYGNGNGYAGYDDGLGYNRWNTLGGGGIGYNRWNTLGGYGGYGNNVGGYYGYTGSNYPIGNRGYGYYNGYPSGYRGYS